MSSCFYAPRFWECSFLQVTARGRTSYPILSYLKLGLKIIKPSVRCGNRVGKTHTKTASNFLENLTLETFESVLSLILKKKGGGGYSYANKKLKKSNQERSLWETMALESETSISAKQKQTKNNLLTISSWLPQTSHTQHNNGTLDFPFQKPRCTTATPTPSHLQFLSK